MNKVFKIVFNAARGTRMVVNETTSSVQSGKKAAVTVAVVGALAAGSAMAASLTYDLNDPETVLTDDLRYANQWETVVAGDSFLAQINTTANQLTFDGGSASKAIRAGVHSANSGISHLTKADLTVKNTVFKTTNALNWSLYGGSFYNQSFGTAAEAVGDTSVTLTNVEGNVDAWGGGSTRAQGVEIYLNSAKLKAENSKIDGSTSQAGRLYGAGAVLGNSTTGASGSKVCYTESSVEVENVTGDYTYDGKKYETTALVYGGGMLSAAKNATLSVGNTSVLVKGTNESTKLGEVYGGSHISGAHSLDSWVKVGSTNVTIEGGTIGKVVGGHHINHFGNGEVTEETVVTIKDGSIGLVVGGNFFDFDSESANNYKPTNTVTHQSKVAKTTVNILGGTVGDVIGGSYVTVTKGGKISFSDEVKTESNIFIENATIKGDVIGGGYADVSSQSLVDGEQNEAVIQISNSVIEITDSKFEGENQVITSESKTKGTSSAGQSGQDSSIKLTNVDASKATLEANTGTVELVATDGKTTSIGELAVDGAEIALKADGASNDAAAGDITKAIQIGKGSTAGATVEMAEGMHQGAVTGTVDENGKAVVTQATNSIMSNTLDLASSAPLAMNRLLMNDVRKRMGDLRSSEGTHGVWARYDGGKLSGEAGLENDFTTIQVGIDTVPVADAPRFGVAFSYTTSDADMKRGGSEMDAFGLAFYGTKMYDNGMFVDVIGRMATADTDVTVDGDKKGTMDNIALSLSGEFGWRFDVTDRFFVEPQAELTYTYVNADTLTLSNTSYEFDSVDSLMGRVGFVAGFKCPADFGNVYVRASAVHEFLGDAAVRGGTSIHEIDGEDTWVEYGIGANFNINKNTYVYADIERTEGAKLEEDWRANVGVRFAF